ncbi:hypothetical protein BGX28_001128 [Mortierella sp. GBA30]|nr:hypothetical protein BGX28_001128 [Mortierella sp. GBA30]
MPFCNSATVSLMETTIDQNCVKSLDDRAGFHALYGFASLYIPFKQGICQRYEPATNGTFCITIMTESLNDYAKKHKNKNKKASGWEIFWNTTELGKYVDGMPKSMLCTPCNKAMINPMNKFVSVHQLTLDPEVVAWVRSLQEDIQKHCGPQFVDAIGPPPDDVATPRSAAISSFSSLSVISLGYPYVISIISGFALLYCYSSLP